MSNLIAAGATQTEPVGRSGRLSLRAAFGTTAAILVLFAAAASAPTLLYVGSMSQ